MPESEDRLIQQAIQGDSAAFAALYDTYVDRVFRHVRYRVDQRVEAEDITQEVFIRAWKAIGRYRQRGAPFLAWLLVIAHNLVVDSYRSRRRVVSLEASSIPEQADDTELEATVEITLDHESVKGALRHLKEEHQKVIIMRFVDGFSHAEVALAMGKSEGAVRVIQFRALKQLRRVLDRNGERR